MYKLMQSIKERIYRAILAILNSELQLTLSELSKLTLIEKETLRSLLNPKFFQINNDEIRITDKVSLAYDMINVGLSVEEVLYSLGWRDVEAFCAEYFEKLNFKVVRNLRFKRSVERYEIDVIAYKHPYVFSIDCKRIKRINEYLIEQAALKQLVRTVALSYEIWRFTNLIGLRREPITLIPLVLLSSLSKPRLISGVPVIPIGLLDSFLKSFENYLDNYGGEIKSIKTVPPRRI